MRFLRAYQVSTNSLPPQKLRLDKWLWAARFFKTRTLAKTAIEAGKVKVNGQRVKVSKDIVPGDALTIRQGYDDKDVLVLELSDQRRGAPIAQTLYEETQESLHRREREAEARRAAGGIIRPSSKPGKRERHQIDRLRRQFGE